MSMRRHEFDYQHNKARRRVGNVCLSISHQPWLDDTFSLWTFRHTHSHTTLSLSDGKGRDINGHIGERRSEDEEEE
jgi:hypothetical protein